MKKKWPYERVVSLEQDNLVVFSYLSAFEIYPDKMGGLWCEWLYNRRTNVLTLFIRNNLTRLGDY